MKTVNMVDTGTIHRIMEIGLDATDQHMDGYFNFGAKQKLYNILWTTLIELSRCTTFVGEKEWIKEHEPKELKLG
jgi:hypothetical protein